MTGGSLQLRRFRVMIRDGTPLELAAAEVGMSLGEAQLTAQEDRRNPPSPECYDLTLSPHQASQASDAQPQEAAMPRPRKTQPPAIDGEIQGKDFARAVRLFRHDIAPAQGKVGEHAQEMSTAYKEIKKHCGIQPQAARAAFRLADMEEDKREDWLRCFNGLIEELGIGVKEDLVDMAEQREPARTRREPKPLPTLKPSDGSETDLADAAEDTTASNVVGLNPNARAEILSTLN